MYVLDSRYLVKEILEVPPFREAGKLRHIVQANIDDPGNAI
jgi:hypothetical protein